MECRSWCETTRCRGPRTWQRFFPTGRWTTPPASTGLTCSSSTRDAGSSGYFIIWLQTLVSLHILKSSWTTVKTPNPLFLKLHGNGKRGHSLELNGLIWKSRFPAGYVQERHLDLCVNLTKWSCLLVLCPFFSDYINFLQWKIMCTCAFIESNWETVSPTAWMLFFFVAQ